MSPKEKRLKPWLVPAWLALTLAPAAADPLAKAIEQAKPCGHLKVSKFGVSVGLDAFESAEIDRLHVEADKTRAKVDLAGALACRTSDSALLKGDARAKFEASLDLDLSTCQFRENAIRIVSTGGTFGFALDAARADIEKALEGSLDRLAKSLCR